MTKHLDDGWLMTHPKEELLPLIRDGRLVDVWKRHNAAVVDYRKDRMGAVNGLREGERAILSLAAGIEQFIGAMVDQAADPYSGGHVHDMIHAFASLLDCIDLGRLDAGTLSSWAVDACSRWGVSYDTGEWIGREGDRDNRADVTHPYYADDAYDRADRASAAAIEDEGVDQ